MTIKQFLHRHPAFTHAADFKAICQPLQLLNIEHFGHACIDDKQQLSAISTHPEFFEFYFNKNYHHFDLHMATPVQQEEYIIWDLLDLKGSTRALEDDFRSFNLGHTFSIVVRGTSATHYYHFSPKLGLAQLNGRYLQQIDQLKQFINYFKDRMGNHNELNQAYQQKLALDPHAGAYLHDQEQYAWQQFMTTTDINRAYSRLNDCYLTRRELACLFWMAKGKTFSQIATLLSISERTVKPHANAAKEKLNCQNLFQLGVRFTELYIPNNLKD